MGGALAETAALWALGLRSSLALAPQVSAPAPFGVFHDLRWLLVYHPSWAGFVAEALALLAFRSVLTAATVRAAWPQSSEPPPWPSALAASAAFTIAAAAVLSPWAALLFGTAVVAISWPFFVALPAMVATALLVHHGAVTLTWWRDAPSVRTMAWVGSSFVVLSVAGMVLALAPAPLWLPVAAATGVFDAWAWKGVVHGVAVHDGPRRFAPLAPAGVVALIVVVASGTAAGFAVVTGRHTRAAHVAARAGGKPVLVVHGFGSRWHGGQPAPFSGDFREQRFSYRGIGANGRPLPYDTGDTYQAVPDIVRLMGEQVEALARQASQPVGIVAESEGALVAKAYLAASPRAPVDRLVLLGPPVRPGRVYYPPRGHDGWGVAAGWELRGITAVLRNLSPLAISTDTPLLRSVTDHAAGLRDLIECTLPGVHQLVVLPLADAVAAPSGGTGPPDGVDLAVVPAFHGGLLGNADARRVAATELAGGHPTGSALWSGGRRVIGALASAWQVPELPLDLNGAWAAAERSTTPCDAALRAMRDWIGGPSLS